MRRKEEQAAPYTSSAIHERRHIPSSSLGFESLQHTPPVNNVEGWIQDLISAALLGSFIIIKPIAQYTAQYIILLHVGTYLRLSDKFPFFHVVQSQRNGLYGALCRAFIQYNNSKPCTRLYTYIRANLTAAFVPHVWMTHVEKCDCCKTITNIQSDTTCLLAELIQHGLKSYFYKVNFVLCIF